MLLLIIIAYPIIAIVVFAAMVTRVLLNNVSEVQRNRMIITALAIVGLYTIVTGVIAISLIQNNSNNLPLSPILTVYPNLDSL